jgi:ribose-phosphate pyrophosphokinase
MVMYKCSILANPQGKTWDFAYSIYENLSKRSEKFEMNEVHIKRFRDNEIKVKIKENIRRKNCFFVHDSSLEPSEWLLELVLVNEVMKNSSANEIIDVLPYMKFSRQDRKDESRVAVNARALSDMIGIYADRVLTIDAHSSLLPSFYRIPLDNLYSSKLLQQYLNENHPDLLENIVVMSPDAGGASRAKAFASKLGIDEIIIGYKYRKNVGEVAEFKVVGEAKNKNILVIDDIIDSGNTLIEATKKLKGEGAKKVCTYCTHGVFSDNARERVSKELDLVMVSNSIPQEKNEKIEIISLNEFFAEAMYRTNEGLSLSELFE